jgi:hypothetical protein
MTKTNLQDYWSVPVAISDIPETGRHFELHADDATRTAVAKLAGLRDLPELAAAFDVGHQGNGLRVTGQVQARVGQDCVVTLEPIENVVEEPIDLVFSSSATPPPGHEADKIESQVPEDAAPEPLIGGVIDLGAIATEFLLLGIDPYPRKPGAVFQPPSEGRQPAQPFAALAALKKGQSGKGG